MSFAITVLGSSGMYATLERACSGYLVEAGGRSLLLDAGAGTWRNLIRYKGPGDIDGVVLSHRHPDHVTDLFQLFHARRYGFPEPMEPIPLWAPVETVERLAHFSKELDEAFVLNPVAMGDTIDAVGIEMTFFDMAHPPETLGCRMTFEGAVAAYSADSGESADFKGLAGDAHLFICEATYQDSDEPWEGHLNASQAGAIAGEVGAAKVVLTHLPPGRDAGLSLTEAHKTAGDTEVQIATDGLRLEVSK